MQYNEPLIIALDAGWGMGKTWFVHKWKNMLKNQGENVIYYNAWENDDWNNALIPIIAKIKEYDSKLIKFTRAGAKVVATTGGVLARQLIRKASGIDSKEITDEIKASTQDAYALISEGYPEFINAKKDFHKALVNLVKKHKHVYIFIDELDRCRPLFAIETLEAIKHFLGISGITFVVSLDMLQLSYSVAKVYGQNINSSGYLSRFFNFKFNFPDSNLATFISNKLKDKNVPTDRIIKISEAAKLSFREADHIIDNFIFIRVGILKNISISDDMLEVYYFFILLKYKYFKTYKMFIDNNLHKYNNIFNADDGELSLAQKNKMSQNISSIFDMCRDGFLHKTILEIQDIKTINQTLVIYLDFSILKNIYYLIKNYLNYSLMI